MPEESASLYQKRIPIHPRSVTGRFRTFKTSILVLAYATYFLLPWLRWERPNAPHQAVLYDLPGRHFYLFDLTIQVQDLFWLAGLLVIAAILLFFVTGLAGRVWCGYFCFQTLWTDLFLMIEHWMQGERPARIRLDKAPWHREKWIKKGTTYALWLLVSFWTGLTFALYWSDAPTLVIDMLLGRAPSPAYITTFVLTLTTFLMAGWAREQACMYMCPYARFQSAMFDSDTLIISYDARRGESSAGRAKPMRTLKDQPARQLAGVGDCVDCGYCVQVCPMGIDIRDGLQYQCISCALCIDACDAMMDHLHWSRGLIRYTSEQALAGQPTRWWKPKNIGYGVVLASAIAALGFSVAHRTAFDITVEQVRLPLYTRLSDGGVRNSYEIKVNNKRAAPLTLEITVAGLAGAVLSMDGMEKITLAPQERLKLLAKVRIPAPLQGTEEQSPLTFTVRAVGEEAIAPIQKTVPFYHPKQLR